MIIYWVWRSNINIPLAWARWGPSLQILSVPGNKGPEVALKMKGGSGIGEHAQTWSMMVIVGAALGVHCTLYWA